MRERTYREDCEDAAHEAVEEEIVETLKKGGDDPLSSFPDVVIEYLLREEVITYDRVEETYSLSSESV